VSNVYNPDNIPAEMKKGVTLGMSMTEKQGGSDVRANTTKAVPTSKHGHDFYLLYGHKWFTSAPMSDAFLTLAQTGKGVTCFIVPRFIPRTSEFNHGLRFQRLKDKLGDRSNASSEVEYHGAYAERLGEEGRGVATILSMVQYTRLDCLVGSAGLMKRCLIEAAYNAENRKVFGSTLIDTPLMRSVLADMALECEAATALAFRIAHCFDSQACLDTHPGQAASNIIKLEAALCRIATPAAKYHICKRAPSIAYECMESLGGNGYVEDGIMARLYRQAPLNAIWEGSGNVICLDLLRCFVREPDAVAALVEFELGKLRGVAADIGPHYDAALVNLTRIVQEAAKGNHGILRTLASTTAMLLQASAMSKTHPRKF
jgi:putative acyl-CoA dehydrogenase